MTKEEKIKLNQQEDDVFSSNIDKYYNQTLQGNVPIKVGVTSNALSISGANEGLDVYINQSTIKKCTSEPSERIKHGHNLSKDIIKQIPQQLRNPILILKNQSENALIAITDLKDNNNKQIIIAVGLERRKNQMEINRITSLYGKDNFKNYLEKQIGNQNLVALNKMKADKLFQAIRLQSPDVETLISYNDSIAYTKDNVKYPTQQNNEQYRSETMTEALQTLTNTFPEQLSGEQNPDFVSTITAEDFKTVNQNISEAVKQALRQPKQVVSNDIDVTEQQENLATVTEEMLSNGKYKNIGMVNENIIKDIEIENVSAYFSDLNSAFSDGIMETLFRLSDENNAEAQNMLGVCYITGMNVAVDEEKATEYLTLSAEQDNPTAQRNLAILLENQQSEDRIKIAELYEKAAKQNDGYALNNLAVCYLIGDGVEQNTVKAVEYFKKAVKCGDDFAMVNLADCQMIGNGVKINEKAAFELYMQAAEKENVQAMRKAADCLMSGIGTKKDYSKALNLYETAAAMGDEISKAKFKVLSDLLNPQKHIDVSAPERISTEEISLEQTQKPVNRFNIMKQVAEKINSQKDTSEPVKDKNKDIEKS